MLKGYILHSEGSEGFPDAVIIAESLAVVIAFLGAEFREQVQDKKWKIVFPIGLFRPPALGSQEERDTEGMWKYEIHSQDGRGIVVYLNLETEVEVVYFLEELTLLMPSST